MASRSIIIPSFSSPTQNSTSAHPCCSHPALHSMRPHIQPRGFQARRRHPPERGSRSWSATRWPWAGRAAMPARGAPAADTPVCGVAAKWAPAASRRSLTLCTCCASAVSAYLRHHLLGDGHALEMAPQIHVLGTNLDVHHLGPKSLALIWAPHPCPKPHFGEESATELVMCHPTGFCFARGVLEHIALCNHYGCSRGCVTTPPWVS